jgi:Protein of unknown function (DUF3563)
MYRALTAASVWEIGKWSAYALFLLAPGSVVVLAVWWLLRMRAARGPLPDPAVDQYLAEATDLCDLERRMRVLERTGGGPAFVTFNH